MANHCVYTNMFRVTNMEALRTLADRIATADGAREMTVRCYEHEDGRVSFAGLGKGSDMDRRMLPSLYDFTQAYRDLKQILRPGEVCAVTEALLDCTPDWVSSHAHIVTRDQVGLIRYPFGEQPTVPSEELRWKLPVLREEAASAGDLGADMRILSSPFRVADRKALDALLAASVAFRPHSGETSEGWPASSTHLFRDRDELETAVAESSICSEHRDENTLWCNTETYQVKEILESPELLQRAIGTPLTADIPAAVPTGDDGAVVLAGRGNAIAYWPALGRHTGRFNIEYSMSEFAWRLSRLIAPGSTCALWCREFSMWPVIRGYLAWNGHVHVVGVTGFDNKKHDALDLIEMTFWLGKACAASGLLHRVHSQEDTSTECMRSQAIHDGFQTAAHLVTGQTIVRTNADRTRVLRCLDTLEEALREAVRIESISPGWSHPFESALNQLENSRQQLEQLIDARLAARNEQNAPGSWRLRSSAFETSDPEALEDLLKSTRTIDGATPGLCECGNGNVRIHGTGCLLGTVSGEPDSMPDRKKFFEKLIPLIQRPGVCLLEEMTEGGRKQGYIADPVLNGGMERGVDADAAPCPAAPPEAYVPLQTDDMFWENVAVPCILPALYAAVSDFVETVNERYAKSWKRSPFGLNHSVDLERKVQNTQFRTVENIIRAMHAGCSLEEGQIAVIRAFLSRCGGIEDVQDEDIVELIEEFSEPIDDSHAFPQIFDARGSASRQHGELTLGMTDAGKSGNLDKRYLAQWALQFLDLWENSSGYKRAAVQQETASLDTQPTQVQFRAAET